MVKHVDDARAETKKATEDREKAVKEAEEARTAAKEGEVNVGMLKSQLDILRGNLGEVRTTHIIALFLFADACVYCSTGSYSKLRNYRISMQTKSRKPKSQCNPTPV